MAQRVVRTQKWLAVAIIAALYSPPAIAQDTGPSEDEIIQFFTKGDGSVKTRGICVGTAGECDDAKSAAALNMFVEFEYNSATLTEVSDRNLQKFSKALLDVRLAELAFELEGHTDAAGDEAYNQRLSALRAETVKNRLVELGVSETRLNAYGLGETKPKFDDPLAPGNRRVEISLGSDQG